jgi:hypothetical protein
MRVTNQRMTRNGKILTIECECGHQFERRVRMKRISCSKCSAEIDLSKIYEVVEDDLSESDREYLRRNQT